jgi:hypothetical protein
MLKHLPPRRQRFTRRIFAADQPNKPLNFTLKGIDHGHPYLAERGIDKETAEYLGVGFFSRSERMAGRIDIPIDIGRGGLIAYGAPTAFIPNSRASCTRPHLTATNMSYQEGSSMEHMNRRWDSTHSIPNLGRNKR